MALADAGGGAWASELAVAVLVLSVSAWVGALLLSSSHPARDTRANRERIAMRHGMGGPGGRRIAQHPEKSSHEGCAPAKSFAASGAGMKSAYSDAAGPLHMERGDRRFVAARMADIGSGEALSTRRPPLCMVIMGG